MKNDVTENTSYPVDSINRFTVSANTFNTANPMVSRIEMDMNVLIDINWLQLLKSQTVLDIEQNLDISPNRIYGLTADERRASRHLSKTDFAAKIRRHLDNKRQDEWDKKMGGTLDAFLSCNNRYNSWRHNCMDFFPNHRMKM